MHSRNNRGTMGYITILNLKNVFVYNEIKLNRNIHYY
jgi:hypothetical protein